MVNIKTEPSQEGNIVPYMIQPMADLPLKSKKRKGDKQPVSMFL